LGQHFFVGLGAEIYVDRNSVGTELDSLLDAADQLLCVRVGTYRLLTVVRMSARPSMGPTVTPWSIGMITVLRELRSIILSSLISLPIIAESPINEAENSK